MTTMTSREFNQDVGRAKRSSRLEPVFVTDRGKPSHVLMSYDLYRELTGQGQNIVELLAMRDDSDLEFDGLTRGEMWDGRKALDDKGLV